MCQLLGMNSTTPASFSFCFKGFCQRGGGTDCHRDGWGLALYEGRGLRVFKDVEACFKSPVARFVQAYPTRSQNVIGHIRCATQGRVVLENVHPFSRELWGIPWCFAHNGDVPVFAHQEAGHHILLGKATEDDLAYHAIGDTDSEILFCAILNALRAEFREPPSLSVLFNALKKLAEEVVQKDPTLINNFLLGCGPYTLFCYSWPGQREGSSVWNGLHYILLDSSPSNTAHFEDSDYALKLHQTTESNRIAVVTTKPLTEENGWVEMKRGELLLFDNGRRYDGGVELDRIEDQGYGLTSRCFHKDLPELGSRWGQGSLSSPMAAVGSPSNFECHG